MSEINQSEQKLQSSELLISRFLRFGVLLSGMFLLVGWVWMLKEKGDTLETFNQYQPQSLIESLHWALVMQDRATFVSFVGLAILVSLPMIRVLMTGILFLKQKEKVLGLMAFLVFVSLLGSLFLGIEI